MTIFYGLFCVTQCNPVKIPHQITAPRKMIAINSAMRLSVEKYELMTYCSALCIYSPPRYMNGVAQLSSELGCLLYVGLHKGISCGYQEVQRMRQRGQFSGGTMPTLRSASKSAGRHFVASPTIRHRFSHHSNWYRHIYVGISLRD